MFQKIFDRLTKMRPGVVCVMRRFQFDGNGNVWIREGGAAKTRRVSTQLGAAGLPTFSHCLRVAVIEWLIRPDYHGLASDQHRLELSGRPRDELIPVAVEFDAPQV